jgi:hypothetical protein
MYAAARVYMAGEGKLKPRLKRLNCLHINRGSRRGPEKKRFQTDLRHVSLSISKTISPCSQQNSVLMQVNLR